ncbi:DUF4144 family protein [Granulosicoccaceae sp. 1_MG-2023]|nr:DUF4144 family protein [Granulosicoccaceae sp. 1_MG-2023]
MTTAEQLQWPVIIHYAGDPELTLLRSQAEWPDWSAENLPDADPRDCLIDSAGRRYRLRGSGLEEDGHCTSAAVVDMIRAHLSDGGHCCVAKFSAATAGAAIAALADMLG